MDTKTKRDKMPNGAMARLVVNTGLTRVKIWRAIKKKQCSESTAIILHHASNGAIPAWELRPDIWKPGQEPPKPAHWSRQG